MNQQQPATEHWEREAIEKMMFAFIKEQRSSRRWRIFFRLVVLLIFLTLVLLIVFSGPSAAIRPHTALINIDGPIFDGTKSSADNVVQGLTDAFEDKYTKGIILKIDSPGGSPVQSSMIYDRIMALKEEYPNTKVYAVCTDICASGAYYIAAAADEIYANRSSIIGSIGVIFSGFGFVDTLEKLGMQRRVYTAGTDKDFMDPFLPTNPTEEQHLKVMLNTVHQQFIDDVKRGRGDRLQNNPELYSGLAWSGVQAKELGLIDDFASPGQVAEKIIEEEYILDYTVYDDFFQRVADTFSASFAHRLTSYFGLSKGQLH